MENDFDPYYKWLGIPPRDQPPNHYRLLGIELFEPDRDVIDAAANRVMSYLKDLAVGDEARHSQKLLNEVSRARLCLLNKGKKDDYDSELRAKLGPEDTDSDRRSRPEVVPPVFHGTRSEERSRPPISPPVLGPSGSPAAKALNLNLAEPPVRTARRPKRAKIESEPAPPSRMPRIALVAVVGVLLLAGGAAGITFLFLGGESTPVAEVSRPVVEESEPSTSAPDSTETIMEEDPATDAAEPSEPVTAPSISNEADPESNDPPSEPGFTQPGPAEPETEEPQRPESVSEATSDPLGLKRPPGEQPSVEPTISDLPERKDFIDPSAMGDEDPAKPKPAEPPSVSDSPPAETGEPGDPTPDPSTPDNPFRDLPVAVTLPPVTQPTSSPAVLGTLHLEGNELCFIKLRGGDKAVRGPHQFTLRNAEGGLAERDWEIVLKEADAQTKIAHLAVGSAGELTFRWEETAQAAEAAPNLCNCALVLSAPDSPTHALALRKLVEVDPVVVELDKQSSKSELRFDCPPDAAGLYVEIVGIADLKFHAKPSPAFLADKGEAWLTVDDGGGLLALKVESSLKPRGVTLEFAPYIQPAENIEPQPFLAKKLPQQVTFAMASLQTLQAQIQGAKQAVAKLTAQQRVLLAQWEQQEPEVQQNVKRMTELQTLLEVKKNKLELQVRVYCDADTSQIDLLRAGKSPPSEPETQ